MVKKISYILSLLLLVVYLQACDKSSDTDAATADVNFVIQNPKLITDENRITEIHALLFADTGSGYRYIYTAEGRSLAALANNATSFQLDVFSERRSVKIYFITNAKDVVANSGINYGDTEVVVKEKLIYNYPSTGITTNFPMWGEYYFPSGIVAGLPSQSITLDVLPALARFDVKTTLAPIRFEMKTIQSFRVNNLLQITPNVYTSNPYLVDAPSIPSGSNFIDTSPVITESNTETISIYLPESQSPLVTEIVSKATCIIVGGRYNGSAKDTYYRIDVMPPVPDYPIGLILRGHLYTFSINDVSGPGWPTPEEAANNVASNLTVDVEEWVDVNIDFDLGGNYYINISNREIEVGKTQGSIGGVFFFTNVHDYSLQWCDQNGVPMPDSEPAKIIYNDSFQIHSSLNVILVEALKDNDAGSGIRTNYFLIIAKRTRLLMEINQLDN